MYINDNGVWKPGQTLYINDNGVWKNIKNIFINNNLTWIEDQSTILISRAGNVLSSAIVYLYIPSIDKLYMANQSSAYLYAFDNIGNINLDSMSVQMPEPSANRAVLLLGTSKIFFCFAGTTTFTYPTVYQSSVDTVSRTLLNWSSTGVSLNYKPPRIIVKSYYEPKYVALFPVAGNFYVNKKLYISVENDNFSIYADYDIPSAISVETALGIFAVNDSWVGLLRTDLATLRTPTNGNFSAWFGTDVPASIGSGVSTKFIHSPQAFTTTSTVFMIDSTGTLIYTYNPDRITALSTNIILPNHTDIIYMFKRGNYVYFIYRTGEVKKIHTSKIPGLS